MTAPTNADLDRKIIALDRKRSFTLYGDLEATSTKVWLVLNMLGAGEASAMYGKPGDGKSVLAQDLALHVAAGKPWHGRKVKQGAVVFIALERRKLIERRAIAFRERHGITDLPFAIVGGVHDFRDLRAVNGIAEIVRQVEAATGVRAALICIDTLSRALCGGDENSSKDIGALVNATARLQEATSAHVMWIHHMPQDTERMRGHGALLGALDTTIHVVKAADGIRTATVIKANDSEEGERVAFTLDSVTVGEDADGNPTTAPVVVPVDAAAARPAAPARKLPDRQQLALTALADTTLDRGQPVPSSLGLPASVSAVVDLEVWKDELLARGVIAKDHANPREAFRQIRHALQRRSLIGERDRLVWLASTR